MSSNSRLLRKMRKIMGMTVVLPSMTGFSLQVSNAVIDYHYRESDKCVIFKGDGELTSHICDWVSGFGAFVEKIIIGPGITLADNIKFKEYFPRLKSVIKDTSMSIFETFKIVDGAFKGCENLKTVCLPDDVETIGENAFEGCGALSNFDSQMPKNVADAGNCKMPESIVEIGNNAFEFCKSLKSITVPITVERIGVGAFKGCEGLKTFNFSAPVATINNGSIAANQEKMNKITPIIPNVDKTFNGPIVINEEEMNKTSFISPSLDESFIGSTTIGNASRIAEISESTFESCKNLESIIIPSTVKKIGKYAFRLCEKLSKVEVPYSVEEIEDGAFECCTSLKLIHIKNPKCKFTKNAFYRSPTVVKLGDQILSFN